MRLTENGALRINYRYTGLREGPIFEVLHFVKLKFPGLVRLVKSTGAKDYYQVRAALSCNFRCSYCFCIGQPRHSFSEKHYNQTKYIWDMLSQVEDSLLVRINFDGETLIDPWAMKSAVYISRIPNVKICEFFTNNSIDPGTYLDRIDPNKTTFNCSFHPEHISLEKFFKHIDTLREAGCEVIASMVIPPEHIKDVPQICESFKEKNIRFRPCILHGYYKGKVYPHDYSPNALEILKKHYYSSIEYDYMMGKSPKGLVCYAGVDMINIFMDGSIRRCSISKIGHVRDLVTGKVKLRQEPYPCPHDDCVNFCHMIGLKELRDHYRLYDTFIDDYYPKQTGI